MLGYINAKNDAIYALRVELQVLKHSWSINENESRESEGQKEGKCTWKTDEDGVVGDELCVEKRHPVSFRLEKIR